MGWKKIIVLWLCAMTLLAIAQVARANGPDLEVGVKAPSFVNPGEKATVQIEISNEIPATSYVDSVKLYDGNTLLREWKYTLPDRQTGGNLYLTYEGSFAKSATLRVEAHSSDGRKAYGIETINVTR